MWFNAKCEQNYQKQNVKELSIIISEPCCFTRYPTLDPAWAEDGLSFTCFYPCVDVPKLSKSLPLSFSFSLSSAARARPAVGHKLFPIYAT